MLKTILLALVAIVGVFAAVVAMQPPDYRIARSATIAARPTNVFTHVNDFHKWEAWSPWAKLDPAAKATFEGAPAGKGAIFKWAGNSEVGEGTMTVTESRPGELVRIKLDFVKPMVDTSTAEFTFKPEGNQTVVTWAMMGESGFIGRAICMFFNRDKVVGSYFEKGLANLKAVAEATGSR
ncbi:MAG TPA: SRPBCC family protein [Hyphomicrobiaceae bacterium]|nr:SRPBCC family protein [Hyphomicrobiaceae bacterium]